jgi:nucleoside 2-deoxyribosyltransferase
MQVYVTGSSYCSLEDVREIIKLVKENEYVDEVEDWTFDIDQWDMLESSELRLRRRKAIEYITSSQLVIAVIPDEEHQNDLRGVSMVIGMACAMQIPVILFQTSTYEYRHFFVDDVSNITVCQSHDEVYEKVANIGQWYSQNEFEVVEESEYKETELYDRMSFVVSELKRLRNEWSFYYRLTDKKTTLMQQSSRNVNKRLDRLTELAGEIYNQLKMK